MPRALRGMAPRFWSVACLMALLSAGLTFPVDTTRAAQKKGADSVIEGPQDKTLTTKDGVSIHTTYYQSPRGKDAAVVVLLHMKDGNRLIWGGEKGFAAALQKEGFAVITVDLRKHGQSRAGGPAGAAPADAKKKGKKPAASDLKPADYAAMVELDLEAVKRFIYEEHQLEHLNMNKLGIVGPEMGATIGAYYAAFDWAKEPYADGQPGFQTPRGQDVRALVLISPQSSFHGMALPKVINDLRDPQKKVAFLFAVGKKDPLAPQAEKLYDQAAAMGGKEERIFFREYAGALRGTDMIGKGLGLEGHILVLFKQHLDALEAPWRDRQSRLNKK